MSLGVNVSGGTGAGRRKPPREKPRDWIHVCKARKERGGVILAGYFARCPGCGARRP